MIKLRRVVDLWRRCDVTVRDLPFPLLLIALSLLPGFRGSGTRFDGVPTVPFDALAILVIALECLPLAVRRRWPAVCLALVALGFAIDQLRGYHAFSTIALPVALISAGAHLERHRRPVMAAASAAYVLLAVGIHQSGADEPPTEYLVFFLALGVMWVIGTWLRTTRAAEADRRRRVAEATRAAERTRIARELHDVVTHHVTAMVVQAEAARYLTAAPDRLDETLSAVTDTGRRAISDLRHLLDLLNPDHDAEPKAPTAGELHTLVEQTRRAGQPVEFTEHGTSGGVTGFTLYRVVQEALTNALKYAHGGRTVVEVHYGEEETTVQVSTAPGSRTGSPGGSGRGLTGLRERVDALGGEFSADRAPDGDFVVRARIPAGSTS
ncbi:two-component sensor histidine kinase [Actinomadura sp. CNU-125]|uniref:sensor histidine kinase n=1 Tax=Actinomadura sp. CNU-125 TaxID=1904961 RepID=UPI00095CB24B|nr:histidine kinase [Actinomadura sp. CNU-125]OLT27336.1 two-component sensor histidine kinase [Actinomadura sp. CNU-125]